jgi:hypothetical protein
LSASQNDPRTEGETLAGLGPARPRFKFLTLDIIQSERSFGATTFIHHKSPLKDYMTI